MAQFDINTYSTTQMHFEQQLEYIPQGLAWLASVLEAHVTGNMKACYYVVHDKDTNTDEENNTHPVAPHVHIAVQFHSSVKVMSVLKWFGWEDKPQLFHKAAEKSRFGSLVSYLTHRTPSDSHKFQYSPEAVVTVTGEPYPEALERITGEIQRAERVKHGKTAEQNADKDEFIARLLPLVDNGTIAPYNITEYCTAEEYVKFRSAINTLFEYYEKRLAMDKEREMNVYFITGASGSGKTTVAKEMACAMYHCRLSDVFVSSGGKNPLDDYGGEKVIILDDLRPSDYKFNDMLKLLDPNTASLAGCRYYNKSLARCRCIIITSCLPLVDWYKGLQESDGEAIRQLTRRVIQVRNVSIDHDEWTWTAELLSRNGWRKAPERRFEHISQSFNDPAEDAFFEFGTPLTESDHTDYQFKMEDIKDDYELPW